MHRSHCVPKGQVHRLRYDSTVLIGNALGDPVDRELHVYTPFGWKPEDNLPLLVDLPGFYSSGPSHTAWRAVGESVPERLDRLLADGAMRGAVVAFPDCSTSLRGNQYINSAGTGAYADYLRLEIVPFVETTFNCGGAGRRGCFGKSSGGFGAARHAMAHPDFWAVAAVNSGDMGFEACLLPDIYLVLDQISRHGGSIQSFGEWFDTAPKTDCAAKTAWMVLAMSAFYDPAPSAYRSLRLPCDADTGEILVERWRRWLANDPVVLADKFASGMKAMKAVWLDCGSRDQYRIHFGMRRFHRKLVAHGVDHIYEEFDDDHTDVDYRMDRFLPVLVDALS